MSTLLATISMMTATSAAMTIGTRLRPLPAICAVGTPATTRIGPLIFASSTVPSVFTPPSGLAYIFHRVRCLSVKPQSAAPNPNENAMILMPLQRPTR